ncbi:hypothetical protein D3C80_442530 [compost metagenome]
MVMGMIQRWSGPTNQRTTCGTINPTKPTGPAAAVPAPARSVTAMSVSVRARRMLAPSERARSSPSATAFSEREATSAISSPSPINGATVNTTSMFLPATDPMDQNRMESKACGSSSVIAEPIPPSTADSATPASTRRTGVAPSRPAAPSA